MNPWVMLAGAIGCEVAATLSLKGAMDRPGLYVVVVVGYTVSMVLMTLCLRHGMALGVAYGIWGATGVVATAILSAVLFSEPVTPLMALGIALVVAGVLTVELGSHKAQSASSKEVRA